MIPAMSYWIPSNFNVYPKKKETAKSLFTSCASLDELTQILTSEDSDLDLWREWKEEIKKVISEHSNDREKLDEALTKMTDWGIRRNPQKTMAIFAEMINLEILTKAVAGKNSYEGPAFKNILELAVLNASECPVPIDTTLKGRIYAEWKIFRPIAIYFIPNLLNIFLGAFNFLDTNKKFTTLWEKHLLLEIVYKFFIIPYCLVQVLQPILVVATKVYLAASLIIVGSGIIISCYQRWFRPLPDEIVNCTNLDKQMERGFIDPKVGQADEINHLIAALEGHDSIILRGLSGEGKTTLIHHFIQLKHEKKLPKKLQDRIVFEADCGIMISSASFGHAELINQTKDQISGYEDKVLLFFDDFYQIAANKAAFLTFKKRFLEDKPRCKCILAVTMKEWKELEKLDTDFSFRRKTYRMIIGPSRDEEVKKILKNYQLHFAEDVFVTRNAIDAVVKLSATKDYLPDIGRPAKAEEIFKTAVGKCRAAFDDYYGAVDLKGKELQNNRMLIHRVKKILAHRKEINSKCCFLSHLFDKAIIKKYSKIKTNEVIDVYQRGDLDLYDHDEDDEHGGSTAMLVLKENLSQKDQIMYLWCCFYAKQSIEKLLEDAIAKIHADIPIQVDAALIEKVFQEIRDSENAEASG